MEDVMNKIKERWDLPSVYLDYLVKYPQTGKFIEDSRFANGLNLCGAAELIKTQEGYSDNPIDKKPIEDWPKDYVVIAYDGGDPYVLDLSRSDGIDAPILSASHGGGKWDFQEHASSFATLMESLNI